MQKVIWHVGAWSNNVGDRVLQAANTDILRERYNGDLRFVYVNTQETYFSKQLIDKMNTEADLLLIGGGGLIFHRPMDHSHSGWQLNIDLKNIDMIKVPIAVHGIGYNKFPYDTHVFPQSMWNSIQAVADKSEAFSVRDLGTYNAMKKYVNMDKIMVVPDAGMFVKAEPFYHQCLQNDKMKIGLNWASDRQEQRFSSEKEAELAMRTLLESCKTIVGKYDAKIYLIEHLLRNDTNYKTKDKLHKMAKDILGEDVVILYDELNEELYPPFDYTAGFFANIYKQMHLVFGMRAHACLIPFSFGVPAIGIGEHNKVRWALQEMELERLLLKDISNGYKIKRIVDDVIDNNQKYKLLMHKRKIVLNGKKDEFLSNVCKLIK